MPRTPRPYVRDTQPGFFGELVAFPGILDGSVDSNPGTEFDGFELLYRRAILQSCGRRWDFVAGYRYSRLDDSLRIVEDLETLNGSNGVALGTLVDQLDLFNTENDFHGAEIGLLGRSNWNAWTLDLAMKLAMGAIDRSSPSMVRRL